MVSVRCKVRGILERLSSSFSHQHKQTRSLNECVQVGNPSSCIASVTLQGSSMETYQQAPKRHPALHINRLTFEWVYRYKHARPTRLAGRSVLLPCLRIRQLLSSWTHRNDCGTYKVDWRSMRPSSLFSMCYYT